MVNIARIYDYRNACGFAFYIEVCKVCNTFDINRLQISEQVQELDSLLVKVVKKDKVMTNVMDLPEELLQLDNRRYSAVRSLRNIANAYSSHFNPVKSKAGKQLVEVVDRYLPKIEMKCLESASDLFTELSQVLFDEPININSMDLLKITDIAQEMSFCNRQFKEKFETMEIDPSTPNREVETEIYSKLRVCYEKLMEKVQALAIINDDPDHSKLIDQLDQLNIAHGSTFERTTATSPIYFS